MVDSEKEELIRSISFSAKSLWIKDFYLSKISKEVVAREKAEGLVKMVAGDEQGMQVMKQMSTESGVGVSPIRVQNNMFDHDQGESLRAPHPSKNTNSPMLNSDKPFGRAGAQMSASASSGVIVPVIELLNKQESFDISFIQAEQFFKEQNFQKAYAVLKKIVNEDPFYVDIIPLFCSVLIELDK